MKKSIALLTALMLCAAMLMGCGGGEADIAGKTTPKSEQAAPAAPKSELTQPTQEPTAEPEEELSLGRMDGGIYENSYAGFGCELDSNWTFYGADELQELPDAVKEGLEGSELGDAVANLTTISDMMAENAEMIATMNVLYTKMGVKERLAYTILSEEEIVNAMLAQKDQLAEAYTQMGITVTAMEIIDVNFLGETHKALSTVGELSGVEMHSVQLFVFPNGQYSVTLTVQSYMEDRTQEVLDLFYKVE